jgi:xylulokinase
MMEKLGAQVGDCIYSAGGGAKSDAWLQIRADTLGRAVLRPRVIGGAMGAAIVAAAMTEFKGLTQATRQMMKIEREVSPRPDMTAAYDEKYGKFRDECVRRGYIEP